jgi:hypothetical protein
VGELERIGEKLVVTYFMTLLRHSPRGTEEGHRSMSVQSVPQLRFELGIT